jgi:transcriptional regulator
MTRGTARSGQLRGTLDVLVLKALSLEPLHGVGVFQRIDQITNHAIEVSYGSLFPALHRLEARGWLDAEWRASDLNRQAKFYRLTRAGKKQLEREEREWRRIVSAVMAALESS